MAISTIDSWFGNWLVAERMNATVSAAVTLLLALCISCVGVHTLLAYAVSRRIREMGFRIAVGATPCDGSMLVISGAVIVAGARVLLGVPAALEIRRRY